MNILTEAFKAFDLLDEEMFPATNEGEERLKAFIDGDKIDEVETIIDPMAETEEEVKESYIGDVILNCPVCQSKFYKEPSEITIDEEKELVNITEECPYCQSVGGFEIVGEVAEYHDHKHDKEEDVEETEEEIVEESYLTEAPKLGRDTEQYQDWVDYDMKRYGKISDITNRKLRRAGLQVVKDDHGDYEVIAKSEKGLGSDLSKYQKWVDYDMKRYNKVSDKTKSELDKAGLELIKDDHGDYEVTPKDKKKLGEAKELYSTKGTIAKLLTDNIDSLSGASTIADLKSKVNNLLDTSELKDKEATKDFKSRMDRAKSKEGLLSMITTYITGTKVNKNIKEDFEEVEVKTDREKIKVEQEGEETKVSIKPRDDHYEDFEEDEEVIVPVSDEMKARIENEQEDEFEEVDIDEFDEESFDELEEKYLRKIYENVKSYKTTKGVISGNKIKLEGVITFNSGNKKKTQFVFEAYTKTKKGKLKFIGENINLSTKKNAFTITGNMKGNKLMTESFTYNYNAKDAKSGKTQKLYGTVRK